MYGISHLLSLQEIFNRIECCIVPNLSNDIVIVMMFVVIAMFWKGIEVLGPSDTNRDILYEGPKKSIQERWNAAYEWIEKKKNENKSK